MSQLRPESRGTVMIKSRDPFDAPAMQPNYLSAEIDRKIVVTGLKVARNIAASPALQSYVVDEYMPGHDAQSDDALLEFARNTGVTIFHPSGTCKMGFDPAAVVDDRLRVHGLGGLRVADCSIMPTLVSGNTHAPVVMIAEKAADMILQDVRAH